MNIRIKFIIFVSVLIVIIVVGVSGFLYFAESKVLKREARLSQTATIKGLAQICREALLVNDDLLLFNYLNLLKNTNKAVVYGAVLNAENQILAHTDATKIRSYDNSKIGLAAKKANDIFSQEWVRSGVEIFELSIPVMMGENRAGTARLGFSKKVLNEILNETLSKARIRIATIGLAALVFGLMAGIIFATAMTGPIKKLVEGAKLIGGGRLDTVIEIKRKDELGWLAEEFNIMAGKLKELDNMKTDFVNSVSHELRSPLSAIKGYVDFLLKEVAGPVNEKQKEFLNIVKNNTTRLTNFINNVLDVAKMESSKMELNREQIKIKDVIGEVITLFKPSASDKKITLEFTADEALPQISADGEKIMQVITNLISNAMKFTPEGGNVTVKSELGRQKPEVVVSVSDSGMGMTKDDCAKLFNKFVQVSSAKKNIKGPKGTGLGLSIAKGIIELHNGKIWVESEINMGTTFYFTLPV